MVFVPKMFSCLPDQNQWAITEERDCLHVHANQCGAKHPEYLRSKLLGKHVATLSQALNMIRLHISWIMTSVFTTISTGYQFPLHSWPRFPNCFCQWSKDIFPACRGNHWLRLKLKVCTEIFWVFICFFWMLRHLDTLDQWSPTLFKQRSLLMAIYKMKCTVY